MGFHTFQQSSETLSHSECRQYKKAKEFIDKLDSVEFDKDSEDEEVQMQFVRFVYWNGYICQNLGNYEQAEVFYELCAKEVESKFSKYPLLKSKLNKQREKLLCQKTSLKGFKKANRSSVL